MNNEMNNFLIIKDNFFDWNKYYNFKLTLCIIYLLEFYFVLFFISYLIFILNSFSLLLGLNFIKDL